MNTPEEFDYWWTNAARNEIAALITQMGLQGCPVCASNEALGLLPWPGVVHIGGTEKPVGAPHRGNLLFMAVVRSPQSAGHGKQSFTVLEVHRCRSWAETRHASS